jgi:hypothetical protein
VAQLAGHCICDVLVAEAAADHRRDSLARLEVRVAWTDCCRRPGKPAAEGLVLGVIEVDCYLHCHYCSRRSKSSTAPLTMLSFVIAGVIAPSAWPRAAADATTLSRIGDPGGEDVASLTPASPADLPPLGELIVDDPFWGTRRARREKVLRTYVSG